MHNSLIILPINCVLIVRIEYLNTFFIQQAVNVKLEIKVFFNILMRKRSLIDIGHSHVLALNHFQNQRTNGPVNAYLIYWARTSI